MKRITVLSMFVAMAFFGAHCSEQGPQSKEGMALSGKELYETHCAICHGDDGKKGFAGARLLPDSQLAVEERMALIKKGKGTMMPYEKILKPEEIRAVAIYTTTLN